MKKIVLSITLVTVLIAGALGGTVMADTPPDDSPKGTWTIISEGIEDILEELGFIKADLDDMDDALGRIEGNMMRMETDNCGFIEVSANSSETVVGGNYTELRHVVVTLFVHTGSLDDVEDHIYVSAYWETNPLGWNVAYFDDESDYKAATFDFNAEYWTIRVQSDEDTGYQVRYAVTTTYVPES